MLNIPLPSDEQPIKPRKSILRLATTNEPTSDTSETPRSINAPAKVNRAVTNLKKLASSNYVQQVLKEEKTLPYAERMKKIIVSPHRTMDDARFLYEDMQYTPFCQKYLNSDEYDEHAIIEVFKNLKYEFYKPGSIIIEEGAESNNKAYILISGTVAIYRKKKDFFSQQNKDAEAMEEAYIDALQKAQKFQSKDKTTNPLKLDLNELNNSFTMKPGKRGPGLMSEVNSLANSRRNSTDRRDSIEESALKNGTFNILKDFNINSTTRDQNGNSMNNIGANTPKDGSRRNSTQADNFYLPSAQEVLQIPGSPSPSLVAKRRPSLTGPDLVNPRKILQKSMFGGEKAQNDITEPARERFDSEDELNQSSASKAMANLLKLSKRDKSTTSDPLQELGTFLKDLDERGEVFGQVALENDSKRTASIVAKDEVECLIITKHHYASIGKKHKQQLADQANFIIRLIPYLDQVVSEDSTREMMRAFRMVDYRRNHTPIVEGEVNDEIIVVYEGEVKLIKTLMVEVDNSNFDGSVKVIKHFRKPKHEKEEITIAHHGKGAIFGEEVLMAKRNERIPYSYTIRVETETAKIFRISRSSLKLQFPLDTVRELRSVFLEKKEERYHELKAELNKRKLEIVSDQLDAIPLIVKRFPLSFMQPKTSKINTNIGKIDSLAILASYNDATYLHRAVPNSTRSDEQEDIKTFESYRNFSRYKFLPQSYDQREEYMENHPESFSSRELLHHRKRHHYMSTHAAPKNIDDFLSDYEKKFKLDQMSKLEQKKIHDVKRFKLNFQSNEEMLLQSVLERQKKAQTQKDAELSNSKAKDPILHKSPQFKKYYFPKSRDTPTNTDYGDSILSKNPPTQDAPTSRIQNNQEIMTLPSIQNQSNEYQIGPTFPTEPGSDISALRKIVKEINSSLVNESRDRNKVNRKLPRIETKGNKYSDKANLKKLIEKAKGRDHHTRIRVSENWDFSLINNSSSTKSASLVQGQLFYLLGQTSDRNSNGSKLMKIDEKSPKKLGRQNSEKILKF